MKLIEIRLKIKENPAYRMIKIRKKYEQYKKQKTPLT